MSTVETTEALDALPPEVAVYPGSDADDQHVYIRDTTEGCWVAYIRSDCVGVDEIPLPAYVPSQTAADQPTTERSEALRLGRIAWDARAAIISYQSDDPDVVNETLEEIQTDIGRAILEALAPAPQPAADTETEVQWGVRGSLGDQSDEVVKGQEDSARRYVKRTGEGTVMTRTKTTTYTPWEEA